MPVAAAGGEPSGLVLGKEGSMVWNLHDVMIASRLSESLRLYKSIYHQSFDYLDAKCIVGKFPGVYFS